MCLCSYCTTDSNVVMFCMQGETIQDAEAARVDIVGGMELVNKVIPYMGMPTNDNVMTDNRQEN